MGRIKETLFHENFDGILSHKGTLKVAKSEIIQPILNIDKRNVLVKGKKNSYVAEIHKDLYTFMIFVEEGDFAFIKWRRGKAWMVGFQKKKSYNENIQTKYIAEDGNCDWQSFLEGVDVE